MHVAARTIFALLLSLNPLWSLSQTIPNSAAASSKSLPDSALRQLADRYYAAYAHKDSKAMMSLWATQSPGRNSRSKQLRDWFVSTTSLTVSDLSVDDIEHSPTRAKLTLRMKIKASNEPSPEPRRVVRTLTCVREANLWKIWSDTDDFETLATALVNAKGEAERTAILSKNTQKVSPELILSLFTQIRSLETAGDFPHAMAAATLGKDIAESIHDQTGVALMLLEFGFIQGGQGKYEDALSSYRQVTTIADQTSNQWLSAAAIGSTGIVFRRQGRYKDALDYELRCLPIFESLGDKEKVSYRLSDVGMTYLRLGDYDSAAKYLQQSLALFEERDDRSGVGFVTNNLAVLSSQRNDQVRALRYYKKALAIAQEKRDRPAIASLLNNIGTLYQFQNDYLQAIAYYNRSLTLVRQMNDQPGEGETLLNMCGLYTRMHNWKDAFQSIRSAQAIFERLKIKEGVADSLASIGNLYAHQSEFNKAQQEYVKALALNEETANRERIAESLDELADNENALGNPDEGLKSSTRACSIAHQMNDRSNIVDCSRSIGESYRLLHQPQEARKAFDEAIAAVESMRNDVAGGARQEQEFLGESNARPYQQMVALLVDEKQFADAFSYAERAKAQALLDVLHSGHERIDKVIAASDRETEQRLEIQSVSLNAQIERETSESKTADLKSQRDKLRLQLEDFETSLYSRYPELIVQRGQAPVITADEASALPVDNKTALLEFMVGERETVLLVLTRDTANASALTVSAYRIAIDAEDLGAKAREFREQIAARQLGFQTSARALYDLLLKPAAAQLKDKTALVIVPDGPLWNLPFQALLGPARHYLLENYAIAYVPSLTVMREVTRKQSSRPAENNQSQLLAFANPTLPKIPAQSDGTSVRGNSLEPLPNAEAEARALTQLYGPDHSRIYTGDQATKARFKAEAGEFNILHLATHGFMSDSSPMYSSILLSRSSATDDGLLEAREIMDLDLHADLVVLSACETARGHIRDGEGIIGLTWAFFAAGVPTTVASQWKVDSASTTDLMLAFHRDLIQERGTPLATARSLQTAALKLLHEPKYAHPFYWAGFVVVGNPN